MKKIFSIIIILFAVCNYSHAQYTGGPYDGYASNKDSNIVIPNLIHKTGEVVDDYRLYQNYPNPFNPSTVIKFTLLKHSKVSLKIYDINGRIVETILDNVNINSGAYEVSFEGKNLSSGIYFYKIESAAFSDTRKMILVR